MKDINKMNRNKDNITKSVKFKENKSNTSIDIALRMAEKGQIKDVHKVSLSNGTEYLRSNPNSKKKDNLENK